LSTQMSDFRQGLATRTVSAKAEQSVDGASDDPPLAKVLDTVVYERLCHLASGILRREAPEHRWEPAELFHEAFLRMARSRIPIHFQSTAHLYALTATVMRHILIDRTRSTTISDRCRRVSFDRDLPSDAVLRCEEMALRDALKRLGKLESRLYQVVEMRFFSGLAVEEIASNLSISARTVKRDWKVALEWLRRELGDGAQRSERLVRRGRQPTPVLTASPGSSLPPRQQFRESAPAA
jgi:RNA polymerase sigma factor (TIGR02999 family)